MLISLKAGNLGLYMQTITCDGDRVLVSVGSCVLASLLLGKDPYIMNLGNSRAVLSDLQR